MPAANLYAKDLYASNGAGVGCWANEEGVKTRTQPRF